MIVVSSSLSRLFAYARTPASDPRENFTTEALAAATRVESRPLVVALARLGVLDPDDVLACVPFTQVFHEGAGTIDLVLQMDTPAGAREVWIEVKVDAPESGQQLRNYRAFIDADVSLRRDLVVLAKETLPSTVPHVALRWRDVVKAARDTVPNHVLWSELVAYLEEIRMADRSTFPITLREASSLDDAFGLFTKALAVIRSVNARLGALGYPDWLVMSQTGQTGWLTSKTHEQFIRFGRAMVEAKKLYRANVFYGFQSREGEVYGTIWVEADPKRTRERQAIRERAHGRLDSWEQPLDHRWQLVIKAERAIEFPTEVAAADWFVARFEELRASGMLELIPTLGADLSGGEDASAIGGLDANT